MTNTDVSIISASSRMIREKIFRDIFGDVVEKTMISQQNIFHSTIGLRSIETDFSSMVHTFNFEFNNKFL